MWNDTALHCSVHWSIVFDTIVQRRDHQHVGHSAEERSKGVYWTLEQCATDWESQKILCISASVVVRICRAGGVIFPACHHRIMS